MTLKAKNIIITPLSSSVDDTDQTKISWDASNYYLLSIVNGLNHWMR